VISPMGVRTAFGPSPASTAYESVYLTAGPPIDIEPHPRLLPLRRAQSYFQLRGAVTSLRVDGCEEPDTLTGGSGLFDGWRGIPR